MKCYILINSNKNDIEEMIKKLNKVKELNGKYIIKYERIELKENYLLLNENEYKYSLESINIKEYFEENAKYKLLLDICNGIKEFHSNKLINGNIKPSNILFNEIGEYKLSDYMKNELFKNSNEIILNKKSINYLSPEILKNEELNEKSDIWSIGCILYLLFNEKLPFCGENVIESSLKIIKYQYESIDDDTLTNDFLGKIFCEKESRMNIDELLNQIGSICNDEDYAESPTRLSTKGRSISYELNQKLNGSNIKLNPNYFGVSYGCKYILFSVLNNKEVPDLLSNDCMERKTLYIN